MKISHNNPLVLMALTWVSSSVISDARIIGGNNSNIHNRGLSDKDNSKYIVYAYNPCSQEVFADFTFLNDQVRVNKDKCKQIGDRTPGKEITYSAYTKNGSDSNNDTINREGVSLQNASDFKNQCGFNKSTPDNVRVVNLSCPKGTPERKLEDEYQVYACNPCKQEVFADFNFLGNDSTVHVNHGKCKSIGALTTNRQYNIDYTAYTKTGSDIDNDKITRTDVRLDKVSDINKTESDINEVIVESGFDSSNVPGNSRIVELSCPK